MWVLRTLGGEIMLPEPISQGCPIAHGVLSRMLYQVFLPRVASIGDC
jgi:hypothetical protein